MGPLYRLDPGGSRSAVDKSNRVASAGFKADATRFMYVGIMQSPAIHSFNCFLSSGVKREEAANSANSVHPAIWAVFTRNSLSFREE